MTSKLCRSENEAYRRYVADLKYWHRIKDEKEASGEFKWDVITDWTKCPLCGSSWVTRKCDACGSELGSPPYSVCGFGGVTCYKCHCSVGCTK